MLRVFVFCLSACFFVACSTTRKPAPAAAPTAELQALETAMTGSYNSSAQARYNDAYYNILLHMQPIWPDRPGYLYVEQAVASAAQKPYRQRVYRLEQRGKRFVSYVYEIPQPERFVGAYADPDRFKAISPKDLLIREGCAVHLKLDKTGVYRGSTKKKGCKSSLNDATYATSRVSINNDFVQSWDRGYNDAGEQVWGATEGGYMFFKEDEE